MDTPGGLLVPSIKRVQELTVMEVAEELVRLHELGIKGKLGEDDLKVSTCPSFILDQIEAISKSGFKL